MSVDRVLATGTGRHRILHLSDTHVTQAGVDGDGVAATVALDRILFDLRFVPDLDLVVVSGDIADDGSTGGCAAVLERVGRFAGERGIPHVYCAGNHDVRRSFAAVFGSGHLGADGSDAGQPAYDTGDECAAVSSVSGMRVITLDSLVPGSIHGVVSDAQLAWLRTTLAEPSTAGSVVVLHHPPITLDAVPAMKSFALRNPGDLGEALSGTDVKAVLCGHFHHQLSGSLHGVPVWVTPGVVTRMDLTTPPHLERAVTGAGATVVDLGGEHSPMFHTVHARDPEAGTQVYLIDPLTGENVAEEVP